MAPDLVFLNAGRDDTREEKELLDAKRKSHAARVAHARRKAKKKAQATECRAEKPPHQDSSPCAITEVGNDQSDDEWTGTSVALHSPSSLHKDESFDPFNAFPVILNRDDHNILRYYLRFSSANIHRAESMAKSQSLELDTYRPFVESKVTFALTQEAATYAILGITAARLTGINLPRHTYHAQATHYITCALKIFRQNLARMGYVNKSDVIKVMFRLASAEWYRGDHRAAQIHMKSMAPMLGKSFDEGTKIMGEEYFVSNISRYDIMMAAEWDTAPLLHPPPRMPAMTTVQYEKIRMRVDSLELDAFCGMTMGLKPKDIATLEDSMLQRSRPFLLNSLHYNGKLTEVSSKAVRTAFASGFLELAQSDLLCNEFKHFFIELVPQWSDMLLLCFSDRLGTVPEDAAWFDERTNTALYDLLFLREFTMYHPRQDALRLILVMILSDMTNPVHWRAVLANLAKVKGNLELLEAVTETFREAYCPTPLQGSMMLWILCIALFVAKWEYEVSKRDRGVKWWEDRAVSVCQILGIYDINDLFMVMVKYCHCGLVQHESLVDLMRNVSSGGLGIESEWPQTNPTQYRGRG